MTCHVLIGGQQTHDFCQDRIASALYFSCSELMCQPFNGWHKSFGLCHDHIEALFILFFLHLLKACVCVFFFLLSNFLINCLPFYDRIIQRRGEK
jgi:hypothetical protein